MKRFIDLITSVCLIILFLPLFIVIAYLVHQKLGSPVIFTQVRPGKNEKPFTMLKFRTMRDLRDSNGNLLADDLRLNRFGRILRSTSLDELPGLFNVVKGQMSLVGPRPLLMDYLSLYTPRQARRHEIRPGLTGLAQVHGRNSISWRRKFALDVWYIDNHNTCLDLWILCLTILKVVRRESVSSQGSATMPKFTGSGD
ncbi:hypothetical protein CHH26_06745 [Qipengyuania flava]|nr:hypothetical protein CHH26_06745 [Qipengyuania flava]